MSGFVLRQNQHKRKQTDCFRFFFSLSPLCINIYKRRNDKKKNGGVRFESFNGLRDRMGDWLRLLSLMII